MINLNLDPVWQQQFPDARDWFSYKGFQAEVEWSHRDQTFIGQVLGTKRLVAFSGKLFKELEEAFREAVDRYNEQET